MNLIEKLKFDFENRCIPIYEKRSSNDIEVAITGAAHPTRLALSIRPMISDDPWLDIDYVRNRAFHVSSQWRQFKAVRIGESNYPHPVFFDFPITKKGSTFKVKDVNEKIDNHLFRYFKFEGEIKEMEEEGASKEEVEAWLTAAMRLSNG